MSVREARARAALCAALAPGAVALVVWVHQVAGAHPTVATPSILAALSLSALAFGAMLRASRGGAISLARAAGIALWVAVPALTWSLWRADPLVALILIPAAWRGAELHTRLVEPGAPPPAWLATTVIWVFAVVAGAVPDAWGAALVIASALPVLWGHALPRQRVARSVLVACAVVAVLGVVVQALGVTATAAWVASVTPVWFSSARAQDDAPITVVDEVVADPARVLVVTFLLLGIVGGLALSSPAAAEGAPVALIDGMFTSFSAACVTGLTVFDPASTLSAFGETVLLLVIQAGGLGIMTFATAGASVLRRRLSLAQEAAVAELNSTADRRDLFRDVRRILHYTLAAEAAGAAILTVLFWIHGDGPGEALWQGVFTSISAFCNAGFALRIDSLMSFGDNPDVLYVVAALIMLGGLGPAVAAACVARLRGSALPVHARLTLVVSAVLWVVPAALFFAMERNRALAAFGPLDAWNNAVFQSVTLRTAGFNSVDVTLCGSATVLLMIVAMFVGGAPGSTAGGIKTTTAAVLVLSAGSVARGTRPTAFGHAIPEAVVSRAGAVGLLGAISAVAVAFALLATQPVEFRSILFETVSALGTVGLSLGATGQLDTNGKLIVIAAMFTGRVGPLSLLLLFTRVRREVGFAYPEQDVAIG